MVVVVVVVVAVVVAVAAAAAVVVVVERRSSSSNMYTRYRGSAPPTQWRSEGPRTPRTHSQWTPPKKIESQIHVGALTDTGNTHIIRT